MGKTHFRSDVRESGARTASFSTIAAGTIDATGAIAGGTTITSTGVLTGTGGVVAGTGTYYKLGSLYIITGAPTAFTKAGYNALATGILGVALATSIPRGTLLINASTNINATQGLLIRYAAASWSVVSNASIV